MLSAKELKPGETGQIEVTVHTEGLTALSKTVAVTTNDARQPQMTLTVTGTVVPEFVLSDRSIYFGNVPRGKEITRELIINIRPERSVKILSAESTNRNVAVKLEQVPGTNGKSVKVVAVQSADANEGYHFGTLVIKTTSPLTPEIKIPVRGLITAAQNR